MSDINSQLLVDPQQAKTASAPSAVSVGVASTVVLAVNTARQGLVLINNSAAKIYLAFGTAAILGSGVVLFPGGVYEMDDYNFTTQAVNAIASAAASSLTVQEFT